MTVFKGKIIRFIGAAIVALLLVTCIYATSLYAYTNQVLAFTASHLLGRSVTFANIQMHWAENVHIIIDDLHVANRPWGSDPDFFRAAHVDADLDRKALLKLHTKFAQLKLTDAHLLLERNNRGAGNWKNSDSPTTTKTSPEKEARHSRLGLPTILNLNINNSDIKFITSSKAILVIDFNTLNLHTETESDPVTLVLNGAYNKLPVEMKIDAQSFDDLRATGQPFKMTGTAQGKSLALNLVLESMDPLNFDQFKGHLHVATTNLGQAAAYFGGAFDGNWPLKFDSSVDHNDDHWLISGIGGALNGNAFHDSIMHLQEGQRFKPDAINTSLNFDYLDIDGLQTHHQAVAQDDKPTDKMAWVDLGKNPDTLIDATLTAQQARFKSTTLSHLDMHGKIADGMSGIEKMSCDVFGGTISSALMSEIREDAAHLALTLNAQNIDAAQIQRALNIKTPFLVGRFGLDVHATAVGNTMPSIEKTTDGVANLTIKNGGIERWANHLVAEDITSIFDTVGNIVPVQSLTAIAKFNDGNGILSPFIFKTNEGTLLGHGIINLVENKMTLLFYTDPATTSKLALDAPIEIAGPFSDIKVSIHAPANHND